MESNNIPPWATLKKAQELSGFSMYSLRTWVSEGKVPCRFSGDTCYLHLPSLLDPNFEPDSFTKSEKKRERNVTK